MLGRTLLGSLVALGLTFGQAHAETAREYPYPTSAVWPAAVRHLRIQEGLKILERDAEAHYVVFELIQDGKTFTGSLELVTLEATDEGPVTKGIVRIRDRPGYVEEGILFRLGKKLQEERGDPPRPAPKPAPAQKTKPKSDTTSDDNAPSPDDKKSE